MRRADTPTTTVRRGPTPLRGRAALVLLALGVLVAAADPALAGSLELEPVAGDLITPTLVTSARDGSNRLFVVEQHGIVKVLKPGAGAPAVFLDMRDKVVTGAQQGLTGLAFHPQHASNRKLYVHYTRRIDNATVIAEFRASPTNPDVADPTSEHVLLEVVEPLPSLASGGLAFGPDGYLYIGIGNAGEGGDPSNSAQALHRLVGKMLRIDIDQSYNGLPYAVPPTNPFYGTIPGRDEIYAYGLRNPWRFSFDRLTGELYAGDVGENSREEIDRITSGGNYGWRIREGTICSGLDPAHCDEPGFIGPIVDYAHTQGRCAVMGGHVYRGTRGTLPSGTYVFGDFCSGEIFALDGAGMRVLLTTSLVISSFGEDESGELYVVDWLGAVYRLTASEAPRSGLLASILPGSRSVQVGATATAFATMIWTGQGQATGCKITLLTSFLTGTFMYQTTSPATNQLVGTPNTPATIESGGSQTFLIAFTPSGSFDARELLLGFQCDGVAPAPVVPALHTLLLSAANAPTPDIVAMVATEKQDGIVTMPAGGFGAFAVATTNLGLGAPIRVSTDTGGAALPIEVILCPTEPTLGGCNASPTATVTLPIASGATPTFAVFVRATGSVPFDPTNHRLNVRFSDIAGVTRGLTSVAIRTP